MKKKVEDWAKRMEYKGKIPDCFTKISGPETQHIWEQLVTKVKPKEEISHIRKNIIINRLQGRLPEYLGPVSKEIEVYNKKTKLEQKKDKLQEEIYELVENLDKLEKEIELKSFYNERLKEEIRENKQKEFLFKQKSIDYEKKLLDVQQLKEKVDLAFGILSTVKGQDENDVVQATLNKYLNKIQSAIEDKNFIKNETITAESIFNDNFAQSQYLDLFKENKSNVLEQYPILNDKDLLDEVKNCLSKNDFKTILYILSNIIQEYKNKFMSVLNSKGCTHKSTQTSNDSNPLNDMYAADIKNRLMMVKINKAIDEEMDISKKNTENLNRKLKELNLSKDQIESIWIIISLKLKEIELTTSVDFLKKELNTTKNDLSMVNLNNLEIIESKTLQTNKNIIECKKRISDLLMFNNEINQSLVICQEDTKDLLLKLHKNITTSVQWLTPLIRNVNTKEIELFKKYDLSYNKKIKLKNGESFFLRDLPCAFSANGLKSDEKNLLQMIGGMINLCDSPEAIISELIQCKLMLDVSKKSLMGVKDLKYTKYLMSDLKEQEEIVNKALYELESFHNQNQSKMIISKPIVLHQEKVMRFWLEMPLEQFVDSKRLFNGQNFQYYKKNYENLFKNM